MPDDDKDPLGPFVVEHYWPGVTTAAFQEATDAVTASVTRLARAGLPIQFLHSTLIPEDESAFCVVAAASRALVERAYAEAGIAYERIAVAIESTEETA